MYTAYVSGRADSDPSENWYEMELQFFDNFVLPLATRMKGFGVFGVSGYEYLSYAKENRIEWEAHGRDLIEKWKSKHHHQNLSDNINQALLDIKLAEIQEEE